MKIISVCSARPNFIKLAAVHRAIEEHAPDWSHIIVHTGQHYDPLLSDVFFTELKIPQPAVNLAIHGGERLEVIERTKEAFARVIPPTEPDIVLVYGDVNGALGAAQAASEAKVPVGHIEAGLRSFDDTMPEEHNRMAIDSIAKFLFVTEQSGVENLQNEKLEGEVHFVGNTMIDTLIRMEEHIDQKPLGQLASRVEDFAIATIHRPSNVDDELSLKRCISFLGEIAEHIDVLLPAHPRFKNSLSKYAVDQPKKVHLLDPMEYLNFLKHLKSASFILTDSGGIQEEATLLGKRCFTLRKNTERPATIDSGSNILIDTEKQVDREKVLAFAKSPKDPQVKIPEFWDGHAGERIVQILRSKL